MSVCSFKRVKWFCFVFPPLLMLAGCSNSTPETVANKTPNPPEATPLFPNATPEAKLSSYEFEPALLITAAEEPIRVEEPGYACPTLYDMDKDGSEDLIVGQFKSGKMKWYRNLSSPGETPKYAEGEWIGTNDEPAEVPGVS